MRDIWTIAGHLNFPLDTGAGDILQKGKGWSPSESEDSSFLFLPLGLLNKGCINKLRWAQHGIKTRGGGGGQNLSAADKLFKKYSSLNKAPPPTSNNNKKSRHLNCHRVPRQWCLHSRRSWEHWVHEVSVSPQFAVTAASSYSHSLARRCPLRQSSRWI